MEEIQKIFCHNIIISPTQRSAGLFQEMSKAELHIRGNIMARKPTVLVLFGPCLVAERPLTHCRRKRVRVCDGAVKLRRK